MSFFVTGGTDFLGRHLIERLLANRDGTVHVLVGGGEGSRARLEHLRRTRWGSSDRIQPVSGDLTADSLGVDPDWIESTGGTIRAFFHLAGVDDLTASRERHHQPTVDGTRSAVQLAAELEADGFHHLSSVTVAGDHRGVFDETMFDVGQAHLSAYAETMFEAERVVREESEVPWRIYRPALVVGSSATGEMERIEGLYYLFPVLKKLRDTLPSWTPLVGVDLGDTNVVPVDYVAKALDHLASVEGLERQTFHLVDPEPEPTIEVINVLAAAAKAPRFAVALDRHITAALPPTLTPIAVLTSVLRTPVAQRVLAETIGRLGVPPEVVGELTFPALFAASHTEQALAGSGISCPRLESYAPALWDYWEQHLDPAPKYDVALREALIGRKVLITGASSGVGKAIALRVAAAGGIPLLVARGSDGPLDAQAEIEDAGGQAHSYPCDVADLDAVDALTEQVVAEHGNVDIVVDDASRSLRRSLQLSKHGSDDVDGTSQVNLLGSVRLVMGLLPSMQKSGAGHVVNLSSREAPANLPRFSADVASKAALNAWSRAMSSELSGDGIRFTTVSLPRVRTPSVAVTNRYDATSTITPAQAADLVMGAIKNRPTDVNTAGEFAHALLRRAALRSRTV